jgi:glycosyltransferase involved in cell wall biosynthesis
MTFNPLICVPTYNNEKTIGAVVAALVKTRVPVLVVNDGSTDSTGTSALVAGATVETHSHNRGKGEALKTAFAYARKRGYTHVLTIDGDGQHEPADVPALLALAEKTPAAIILGVRQLALIPPKNRFGNRFSNVWVNWAMGKPQEDTQCGLRVYPADLLEAHRFRGSGYELETEAIIRHARANREIVPHPVHVYYPAERVTHFKPWRDATRIVLLVMRFLFLPRALWSLCLAALVACATVAAPKARQELSESDSRALALKQTTLPFTASQHIHFHGEKDSREADALFIVYPGRGYRLRVLGPLMVTLFDAIVRCGRYALIAGDKHHSGEILEADAAVPFFPVRALEHALQPLQNGEWRGNTFEGEGGVSAKLGPDRESFSDIDAGAGLGLKVLATTRVQDVVMPKKMKVSLSEGRWLEIENNDIGFDVPTEAEALSQVSCASH